VLENERGAAMWHFDLCFNNIIARCGVLHLHIQRYSLYACSGYFP
jgi:hypothetical protein